MKNNRVFIIAEAGVNHNGSFDIAKKLIDVAANSGADAVKFQTYKAEQIVSYLAPKAAYQKKTSSEFETQFEMIKKFEIDKNFHIKLLDYCNIKKIQFLSSPFDLDSIDLLLELGIDTFKIPSGEITNLPYLLKIGRLKKKIILSTGMSYMEEVKDAVRVLIEAGSSRKNITVLHCNSDYPTKYEDVNLLAMITLKKELGVDVGYSDHTLGIEIPIAAVALGAKVIEKHFTIDKKMDGPDHIASLDPVELNQMVKSIRIIEQSLGSGIKQPSDSEKKNIVSGRKSIVAATDIKKGEVFSLKNIAVKRPGNGISPMEYYNFIGKPVSRDYKKDELIQL